MRPNDMPRPFAPDHSDGDDLVQRLRESAIEIASAGHYGWGNACTSAADAIERLTREDECKAREIERLRACLKYEEHRFATQSTHSEGCHSFGPRHYECALQEVERLRAEVAWLRAREDEIRDHYKDEVRELQIALHRWLPQVPDADSVRADRIHADAILLAGLDVEDFPEQIGQATVERAENAERELAALRERLEKAPVAEPDGGWIDVSVPDSWNGNRVRLVRED